MDPGQFLQRLTLQRVTNTRTEDGGFTETWADVLFLRARVEALDGREFWQAAQAGSEVTHLIHAYFDASVTSKDRLYEAETGRTFNILSVVDPEGTRRFMQVRAKVRAA